ncbi:DUF3604 domain-containing protein [Emcibacter sp. SYSU 3D8]|uniref:DUF3604 domain-containing protein n=1 Tax=Emcibacter sp. SYSU 3D8 TaxID=3133969 RepID=UPI0031FEE877
MGSDRTFLYGIAGAMLVSSITGAAFAAEREYSPGVGTDYPKSVYFGDLHLHTRNSPDAYGQGNKELSPADAYKFARGEEVLSSSGVKARLKRPLDFLAVTDHGEFIGAYYRFTAGDPALLESNVGKRWSGFVKEGKPEKLMAEFVTSIETPDSARNKLPEVVARSIWSEVAQTADQYNAPGRFTTFAGYEWTSMTGGNNLHRVILFKDRADAVSKILPFSAQDAIDPEKLWTALEGFEKSAGVEVLSIPHNSNLSNGIFFDEKTLSGGPLTKTYAETRMRWEPIVEVTQIKGDSETHPVLSPTDEFADFERWDSWNIMGRVKTTPEMLPGSYARSALKRGLEFEQKLGANPYKFGMIGSTDDHTALPTTTEDNFFGKFANSEPNAHRSETHMASGKYVDWQLGSSGLAAVWAPENTREALFAAMKRKEVYATSGSRIMVRFFGGWDYARDAVFRDDYVKVGYGKGVPMGGDLTRAPAGKAPVFMMLALKDPDDANLDRIQIVKGWLDKDGKSHEKVYDLALSDGRKVDPKTGKAPPVGSTVDVADASYTNTIGTAELAAVWTDPDFDPAERAFYYGRVIEIPKPRWTAYDAKFFGVKMPPDVPMVVQDRAYTSPIWYTP